MDIAEQKPDGGQERSPATSVSGRPDAGDGCRLFGWLWARLSALLGTPATAALMRRAISAAAATQPALRGITITRERLTYSYRLPEALCSGEPESPVPAYRALVREVFRLTGELTGGVLVRGLLGSEELSPWLPDVEEVDRWLSPQR